MLLCVAFSAGVQERNLKKKHLYKRKGKKITTGSFYATVKYSRTVLCFSFGRRLRHLIRQIVNNKTFTVKSSQRLQWISCFYLLLYWLEDVFSLQLKDYLITLQCTCLWHDLSFGGVSDIQSPNTELKTFIDSVYSLSAKKIHDNDKQLCQNHFRPRGFVAFSGRVHEFDGSRVTNDAYIFIWRCPVEYIILT